MYRRAVAYLFLAAIFVACSSDDTGGGADSDAGGNPDGSAADATAGDDAAPSDGAVADAAVLPDAASQPDAAVADCGRIQCDCTFKGIPLFGEVQYVTGGFPDVRVRVTPFPDLRVREGSFADSCGEWEIVDNFPDFTVEIVTSFEDFGIEYSPFPGIP
jgi:hypothetical protein